MLAALCMLGSLAACTTRYDETSGGTEASGQGKPLIWKVSGGQSELYLFGSIHVGTEDMYPLDSAIEAAYDECDYLAVELDLVAFEERMVSDLEFLKEISPYMYYTDGTTIDQVLDPEVYSKGKELLLKNQSEMNEAMLDICKPYSWVSLLGTISTDYAGLDGEYGVDRYLLEKAHDEGKEVLEVEGVIAQLEMFDNFSDETANMMVESALSPAMGSIGVRLLLSNWQSGSLDAFTTLYDPAQYSEYPEYFDAMYTQRNILMADTAAEYMESGKKVFFVVGLAHMVGEGGMVDLLQQQGYEVELLD